MPEGIADLSYRHYSGEMASPKGRWLVIARIGIQNAFKNRGFWIYTALSAYYPVILISFLYIMEQSLQAVAAGGSGGRQNRVAGEIFERLIWGDQIVYSLQASQLLLVIITMVIGAGTIANDNRSNALLVYLSRPLSRGTYLLGKWAGLFVPLAVAVGLPALVFFVYGAMNYRSRGFLSDDPFLILKILAVVPLVAGFYSSLMVGISSLVRQPRLASAVFFGLYILSYFFSLLMTVIASSEKAGVPEGIRIAAEQASYLSLSGLMNGLTKVIFMTNGSPPFGGSGGVIIPRPDWWVVAVPIVFLVSASLLAAWQRIKAVEVVR